MTHGRELLKTWLQRSKMTQTELAEQLRVTKPYLSNIVTGVRRRPSLEIMIRLQELTGVPVSSWADMRDGETDDAAGATEKSAGITE